MLVAAHHFQHQQKYAYKLCQSLSLNARMLPEIKGFFVNLQTTIL